MRKVLGAVALGGALGAAGRYGLDLALPWDGHGLPWATLGANVLGSGLLGLLLGLLRDTSHRLLRPFLGTGMLGGFTTFSTYAVQINELVARELVVTAMFYLAGTLIAALSTAWCGAQLGRLILRRRQEVAA